MIQLRLNILLKPIGVSESFISRCKESCDILIGAYEREELVGCCVLTQINNQTIQLRQMAVDIAVQGTGIGAAIVEFAESIAKEKGYTILLMHARDTVIPFYEKCGYYTVDGGFNFVFRLALTENFFVCFIYKVRSQLYKFNVPLSSHHQQPTIAR
jgi:N-acetylglutamate synthase-like GNAT family acetyltransferase